jgi:hypothetical protein
LRLKILDKPIATAGLGIVCALALLAFLSWPGLLSSSPTFSPAGAPSSTSTTRSNPLDVTIPVTEVTTVESATTGPGAIAINYSNGGVANNFSSSPASTVTTVATETTAQSVAVTAGAQPLFALVPASTGAPGRTSYTDLAVLSIISVVVALASMFLIKRRFNAEEQLPAREASV